MKDITNASQWLEIQCCSKLFYTPNKAIIDFIQKNPHDWQFWRQMQTQFACVIYDASLGEIIAVRDHFGLEPAYYAHINGQFIFGSTIVSVLKYMKQLPAINTTQITNLFFNKLFNTESYSDETYYQSIYRLEPGHELRINLATNNISYRKTAYWDLRKLDQTINYPNSMDYVEHFSALLSEALTTQIGQEKNIAAEFSGGLDSSAIVASAHYNNIQPALFMHVAPPGSDAMDDMKYAQIVIDKLDIKNIYYIDANNFDLTASMNEYAQYFAGGAPYAGFVLASNIHRAVVAHGYKKVLSGVGGDECVSSHAPLKAYIPQLMNEKKYKLAWHELYDHYQAKGHIVPSKLKRLLHLIKLAHPRLSLMLEQLTDIDFRLKTYLKNLPPPSPKTYHSLSEYEYDVLQGPSSHHLRMRIEYAAVAANAMGFNYIYPLLYPKLIEFCYQLPLEQKRVNGVNRFLIRNYLARFFSPALYSKHSKSGAVTPATREKIQALYNTGTYNEIFCNLPFQKERDHVRHHYKIKDKDTFIQDIPAYMFKAYWESVS